MHAVDGRSAIYARRLDTGEELTVGQVDERFPTGSAAEILVLVAFAAGVADGTVDPAQRIKVRRSYRDARPGSGVLGYLDQGLRPTLQDCATLMMIVSDNVATDLLVDALRHGFPTPAVVKGRVIPDGVPAKPASSRPTGPGGCSRS